MSMRVVEKRRITQTIKPLDNGGLAQLGEHLLCKQGVNGSIPLSSTMTLNGRKKQSLLSEKQEIRSKHLGLNACF
jgi:hypothetical protein